MEQNKYLKLPDSELEVMRIIWQSKKPVHTGEVHQMLDPGKKRKIQATQTLLGRLCDKSFVKCDKIGRLNYYMALVCEEKYRAQETTSFIEKMYGNSPARLIASLVENHTLSEEDILEIQNILNKGGEK